MAASTTPRQVARRTPIRVPAHRGNTEVGISRPRRHDSHPTPSPNDPAATPPRVARTARRSDPPPATPVQRSPSRRSRALAVAAGVLLAITVAAAVGGTSAGPIPSTRPRGPSSYDIQGLVSLAGPRGVLVSTTETVEHTEYHRCFGQLQYGDISDGTVITVYDDHDHILAYGSLGPGRAASREAGARPGPACYFPILVTDVPAGPRSYQVQIGQRTPFTLDNTPDGDVLYAWVGLDDDPNSRPAIAAQPPKIPHPVPDPTR